jgi:predicted nucleic acid-binding protein
MAINYSIQAEVVDITTDSPKADDVFLVDTNVWYWMTYTRASLSVRPPAQYQTCNYPAYTNAALAAGARIYQSGLSLAELTHLIEKAEREIYERTNGPVRIKEYRHNFPDERTQVIAEIQSAWGQVVSLSDPLVATIDGQTANIAIARFQTEKVDGYDLFILESMKNHGIVQVITDDGDFTTVSEIQVFTANRNVIAAAKDQGKLKIR